MRTGALLIALLLSFAANADEDADLQVILDAVNDVLEHRKTGETVPWANIRTGSAGTVTVEGTFTLPDGTPCRAYTRTQTKGEGAPNAVRGTACRTEIGFWALNESPPPAQAPE